MKSFRSLLESSLGARLSGELKESEETFFFFEGDISSLTEDQLFEGAGPLSGVPSHIAKNMTGYYRHNRAGENSESHTFPVKNKSNVHTHVAAGLDAGHHVLIKKHGKVIASIHGDGASSGQRETHKVLDGDNDKPHAIPETKIHRGKFRSGRWEKDYVTKHERTALTKGEAISHAQQVVDASGGHDGVEVVHVSRDKNRDDVIKQREQTRGVYRGTRKGSAKGSQPIYDRAASNPEDAKSFGGIAHSAAKKLVAKYSEGGSANDKAKELHAAVGRALESGDHHAVSNSMAQLQQHLNNNGYSKTSYEAYRVIDAAGDLSQDKRTGGSYAAGHFVRSLRNLKDKNKK